MHCSELCNLQERVEVAVEELLRQDRLARAAFHAGPDSWQQELHRLEQAEHRVAELWAAFLEHREAHGCELESRWLGYTA